jgi:uncharacterized membrane protein
MGEEGGAHSSAAEILNVGLAVFVQCTVGLVWVVAVGGLVGESSSEAWGGLWAVSAFALWIRGLVRCLREKRRPGSAWGAVLGSWGLGAFGPLALAYVGYQWRARREVRIADARSSAAPTAEVEPVNPEVEERLAAVELQLGVLTRELAEIRRLAEGVPAAVPQPSPQPALEPPPAEPPAPPPLPTLPPLPPRAEPRAPRPWEREIDFGELLGAKGLAWAGGIVTVLGVVFFFVLAVNRGWIGPGARVALGSIASALVFSAGIWLHRRYGPTYSAYAAVGAGLAGGYATLVAAAALYDLVPDLGALAIAGGIAAVGLATSLLWGSELVAGIGLIGAALVPLMVLFERDLSPLGTAFVAIVFAATAVVSVHRRWERLLAAGFVASLPQVAIIIGDGEPTDWDRVALGMVFAALYLAAAIAFARVSEHGLPPLAATMAIVAGVLAGATGAVLFTGDDRGWVVLAAALPFGVLAAGLYRRQADRDLSALLAAIALALVAVGLAFVLAGPSLAIAWAAEAAGLAWLSRRIDEPRYAVAAVAYLVAATVRAVGWDAPPEDLWEAAADPASGALAPLAVAVGAGVVAFYSRAWGERAPPDGFFLYLEPALAWFRDQYRYLRLSAGWLAGIGAVYAGSLAVLGLTQAIDDSSVDLAFERGHVLVLGLWGLVAVGLVIVGRRIESVQVTTGGLILSLASLLQVVTFGLVTLDGDRLGAAFVVTATASLATAFADEFPPPRSGPRLSLPAVFLVVASVCLAVPGLLQLIDEQEGFVLLGITAFYLALAALVFRRDRDFSTALWVPALVVGVFAAAELVESTWLVLAWSAASAALALVSRAVAEERLVFGSAGYLILALAYALAVKAPPDDFFRANADPADGVPSLLFALAAGVVFVVVALGREEWEPVRVLAAIGAAVLTMYTISLAILGLFEEVGTASVETDFQRGHSAVSTFWGIVGLVALYVGLTRNLRALRLAGFALFGLALAKLFLYDLANLSSITRALSFLAVGGVLLLAGFFYQRLTAEPR